MLVTTCVAEVERRGLHDVGIYRVSGLSSDVQRLKKAFEKSKWADHLCLRLHQCILFLCVFHRISVQKKLDECEQI